MIIRRCPFILTGSLSLLFFSWPFSPVDNRQTCSYFLRPAGAGLVVEHAFVWCDGGNPAGAVSDFHPL